MQEVRKIGGMTKAEFMDECILIANNLNPDWELDLFGCDEFIPWAVWKSPWNSHGFSLSPTGGKFFEQALQLTPYYMETRLLYSKDLINLNKRMPWPYTAHQFEGALSTKVGIYSSEVAVWAALYDNDLDALIEAYGRK